MLTSLAPSPIDRVVFWGNLFFISYTISAFCLGLTLHASTTSASSALFKNFSLSSAFNSISAKLAPPMIMACFFLFYFINFNVSSN